MCICYRGCHAFGRFARPREPITSTNPRTVPWKSIRRYWASVAKLMAWLAWSIGAWSNGIRGHRSRVKFSRATPQGSVPTRRNCTLQREKRLSIAATIVACLMHRGVEDSGTGLRPCLPFWKELTGWQPAVNNLQTPTNCQ
jgi:hypothetical protein